MSNRLTEAKDELFALTFSAMGGLFTDEEQAHYDALCDEIERLEGCPPPAYIEVIRAGGTQLPGFDTADQERVAAGGAP